MTKNDLKLIGSFIDTKNPKEDLNYAHLLDDGIYATDTRKAIHFNVPMLNLNLFLHKKLLAGFASAMKTDDNVTIDGEGFIRIDRSIKMNCNTFPDIEHTQTNIKRILDQQFQYRISLEEIEDIYLRMLTPRELYRGQGFPDSYKIDIIKPDGKPLPGTAKVRMCGNSVPPPLAKALVNANFKIKVMIGA